MSTLDATRETARRPLVGRRVHLGDVILQVAAGGAALGTVVLLGLLVYKVVQGARLSISTFGLGFVTHVGWDPLHNAMGAGWRLMARDLLEVKNLGSDLEIQLNA